MFRKFSYFAILFNFSISRYVKIRRATNNFTSITRGRDEIVWWKIEQVASNWEHATKLFDGKDDKWPSIEFTFS